MSNSNNYIAGNDSLASSKQKQSHERAIQKEDHNHEEGMKKLENERCAKAKAQDLGWVGLFFGSGANSSKNITAIINIVLILGIAALSLAVYIIEHDKEFAKALWTGIIPVITLSLGYLFGKK